MDRASIARLSHPTPGRNRAIQHEDKPNLRQPRLLQKRERDRRFAVPRCWSRGDSNRRSHPTKCLVAPSERWVQNQLISAGPCRNGSQCLVAGAEEIRTTGPLCAPYIQGRLLTREISTRSFHIKPHREVFFDAIYRDGRAENELVLNLSLRRSNWTYRRMGPAVRIPSAPATRHCEPVCAENEGVSTNDAAMRTAVASSGTDTKRMPPCAIRAGSNATTRSTISPAWWSRVKYWSR